MKKCIALVLVLICFLALSSCKDVRTIDLGEVSAIELRSGLTGEVVEINEPSIVQKITDQIRTLTFQSERRFDGANGYAYMIIWMNGEGNSVARIQVMDKEGNGILYGGHYYRMKDNLTIDTGYLQQLLGEQDNADESESGADVWGVTLELKNVTPSGAALVISHSGDAPGGMLDTGSPYWVERWQDGAWVSLDSGEERAWTMEAWPIPMNGSREDEVNWVNLYGQLPAGQYRLGKEIMLLRGPGDYDERPCYAEFVIE